MATEKKRMRRMLHAAAVLLISAIAGCALPKQSRTLGEDPRAGLVFTRVALLGSTSPAPKSQSDERQFVVMFRAGLVLDERGRRMAKPFTHYYFWPRKDADGLKVAVLDDPQMDEIWRLPRIQRLCEPILINREGYSSTMIVGGQFSRETPNPEITVEARNDGTYRVKLQTLPSPHMNRLTTDPIVVDVPAARWLAIPCNTQGTDDPDRPIAPSIMAKDENRNGEDMLIFLKVEDLLPPATKPD
jgi:hypothetical protein